MILLGHGEVRGRILLMRDHSWAGATDAGLPVGDGWQMEEDISGFGPVVPTVVHPVNQWNANNLLAESD